MLTGRCKRSIGKITIKNALRLRSEHKQRNYYFILRLSRSAERSKRIFTKGVLTVNGSAALSQKAALQMQFMATTPPVKVGFRKVRRLS